MKLKKTGGSLKPAYSTAHNNKVVIKTATKIHAKCNDNQLELDNTNSQNTVII